MVLREREREIAETNWVSLSPSDSYIAVVIKSFQKVDFVIFIITNKSIFVYQKETLDPVGKADSPLLSSSSIAGCRFS